MIDFAYDWPLANAGSTRQFHGVNQGGFDSVFNSTKMSLPKNADPNKTNFPNGDPRESLDCRCALLTGPGRSAIAVIGVRGRDASELVSRCFLPARQHPFRPGQVRYGQWTGRQDETTTDDSISTAESVVIVPLEAADFEIHCHGGVAASTRIINDLLGLGAERVETARWIGDLDAPLLIREAERVLTACLTAPMAAVAMDQIRGAMLDWCQIAQLMLSDPAPATLDKIRVEAKAILLTAESRTAARLAISSRFVGAAERRQK